MSIPELLLIALGLSMDAFAVAVCKGLALRKVRLRHMVSCGLYFGLAQALMPVTGWLLGVNFRQMIESIDHWIAFVLLGCIGMNMLREALGPEDDAPDASFRFSDMALLAVATSIDALAIGVTFAFLQVNIAAAAVCIGAITCALSMLGVKLGGAFGRKWKARAEFTGGAILILMGLKILLEHIFC